MTKTEAIVDIVRVVTLCALCAFAIHSCNECYRIEMDAKTSLNKIDDRKAEVK